MAAFTLDTSGEVRTRWDMAIQWQQLDPFTQGALAEATRQLQEALDKQRHGLWMRVGFANWSPEALALIRRDCEAFTATGEYVAWAETLEGNLNEEGAELAAGQAFWLSRNRALPGFLVGPWPEPFASDLWAAATDAFPPLTVTLGDDGKVYLREAA